jgi:hypothetical protein
MLRQIIKNNNFIKYGSPLFLAFASKQDLNIKARLTPWPAKTSELGAETQRQGGVKLTSRT